MLTKAPADLGKPIPTTIRVQTAAFDLAGEVAALRGMSGVGAVVTFTGICRDEDGRLVALELEHYPGMAESEIARIAEQAAERWPVLGITVIHRHGRIAVGEDIVLVVTASAHREAAFEAGRFIMDFLKTSAPFWKKEHLAAAGPGGWVATKSDDDKAADRWGRPV